MEYGLIGEKLGHSFSKEIHNQIGDYDYILKEIPRDELTAFMESRDFKGINVTIPYKQDVIPFLDYIDEAAREIGAVNTIVNRDGKLYGYNTDFIGLKRLILSKGLDLSGKKVLVLGTGGTSRTARTVAKALGAAETVIVSRKPGEGVVTYEEAAEKHKDARVIINTTPAGMYPQIEGCALSLDAYEALEGVIDVIYNPLRTKLVLQAQKRGLKADGGLYMLVQQAVAAAEYFFDRPVDPAVGEGIFMNMLGGKQNVVLTGMPGSGKSAVGKRVAAALGREFLDTDDIITMQQGKTPAQLINELGEPAFRDIESGVCRELAVRNGVVISTGGGAVLREENVVHLKNNGKIFFIDRAIENIRPTENRPLSDSLDKLRAVYEKRYPIYTSTSDVHIVSDNEILHTVAKITDEYGRYGK